MLVRQVGRALMLSRRPSESIPAVAWRGLIVIHRSLGAPGK